MDARPNRPLAAREHALALAAIALAGVVVFRGALAYFFAQDDFAGLARAAGVLPRLAGPWRVVSGQLYFDLMRAAAGLDAGAYHAVSLAAHLACGVLLWFVLRARVSAAAALLGTLFFVTHPALYTALYSVSGIGEILALLFALAALLATRARGAVRWTALPLFALSLLSKESLLLLPALVALDGARGEAGEAPPRRPLLAALAAVAVAYLAAFLVHDVFGVWKALPASAPYALAFDGTLGANLLTYAGWAANFTLPGVRAWTDAVDPLVTGWGVTLLLAFAAGAFVPALRARGWTWGVVAFAAFLLPVLPLAHHTYHYYLYAPLAGLAACVAALADAAFAALVRPGAARRAPATRRTRHAKAPAAPDAPPRASASWAPATAALALGALLAWNGAALVHKVETMPFRTPDRRADPTVDRALIAAQMRAGLARAAFAPGERLRFWSPYAIAQDAAEHRDTRQEGYAERNVRSALFDGVGVRVLFPRLSDATFTHEFAPGDSSTRWAIYAPDGSVWVMTAAEVESALRGDRPMRN